MEGRLGFYIQRVCKCDAACVVKSGTLVFPHRGSIGEVAIIPADDHARYFLSTSLMKIEVDERKANPLFVYFFFRSHEGRNEILKYASQVGTPGIGQPLSSLRQFKLPLPPLAVQNAIASILGALDDKIELNRRMNETLETMARAVFKDWFVDFGPTRVRMEGRAPYLAPEIWALFPDQLDEGKPAGWKLGSLTDIAEITMGISPDGSTYNEQSEGVPLVNGPVEYGDFFLRRVKWTTAPNKVSRQGDLIICVRGSTTGRHAFADGEYCLGRGVASIRSRNDQQAFVDACVLGHIDRLLQRTTGSVFPSLSSNDFRSFDILVPCSACRIAFCEAVRPIRDQVWANVKQSNILGNLRDLLLPKLMSGEIRVKDAEKVAEAVL